MLAARRSPSPGPSLSAPHHFPISQHMLTPLPHTHPNRRSARLNFPNDGEMAANPEMAAAWRAEQKALAAAGFAPRVMTQPVLAVGKYGAIEENRAPTVSGGSNENRAGTMGTSPNASSDAVDMPAHHGPVVELDPEVRGAVGIGIYGGSPLVNFGAIDPSQNSFGARAILGTQGTPTPAAGTMFHLGSVGGITPGTSVGQRIATEMAQVFQARQREASRMYGAASREHSVHAGLMFGTTPFGKSVDMVDVCEAMMHAGRASGHPSHPHLGEPGAPDAMGGIMYVPGAEDDMEDMEMDDDLFELQGVRQARGAGPAAGGVPEGKSPLTRGHMKESQWGW